MNDPARPLRILLVEDSPADAELVLRALRGLETPIEHRRVASATAFQAALREFAPDVVLSDFELPGFGGLEALRICSQAAPDAPFVFVSGTIGEERAIEALHHGASDYVLKDRLARLPMAVRQAVDSARERAERRHVNAALRESEARFRSIVENSKDWIWENDLETRIRYSNGAITRILGYAPEELLGMPAVELMLPEARKLVEERWPGIVAKREGWHRWRLRCRHRDGSIRVLESSGVPRFGEDGTLLGYRGVDEDVTSRLAQEQRIRQLSRIHAVLAATSSAALRSGTRQEVMATACRVAVEHGDFLATCIGLPAGDGGLELASAHGNPHVIAAVKEIGRQMRGVTDPELFSAGARALLSNAAIISPDVGADDRLPAWVRSLTVEAGIAAQAVVPLGNPPWGVLGLYLADPHQFDDAELGLFQRLTAELDFAVDFVAKAEELEFLAYHDRVSGLPNREAFLQRLRALLGEGPTTAALVTIERFNAIVQSRGRAFADGLLRQAGSRLSELLPSDAVLAHVETHTFALAHRAPASDPFGVAQVQAILETLGKEPLLVDGEAMRIDLVAGVVESSGHDPNPEAIEHAALAALDEGRVRGETVYLFDEALRGRAAARLELEAELHDALDRGQFELFYQPKFDVDQQLVGAEALLRWRHPDRGIVSPAAFIPVLEQRGLIVPVGRWAMAEALRTALAWRPLHPGLRIAVNVSARELHHRDFIEGVQSLLDPHRDAQVIDMEITESLLMADVAGSMRLLESLRELGCRVSIDDFGTGYSSLNYLARLPVDTIKIDQSFVAVMTQSPQTLSLVTVIINLAHSLSLDVVAEGVEEEGQAQLLRLLQCDVMQGFLLGRPVPAAEFEALFLSRGSAA